MCEKSYNYLDNYISDDSSICREERQYALYLYNIIFKCKYCASWKSKSKVSDILDMCGIKDEEITNVFYEVTFMRDIFERIRRCEYYKERFGEGQASDRILNNTCKINKEFYEKLKKTCDFNTKLIEFVKEYLKKQDERLDASVEDIKPVNLGHNKVIKNKDIRFIVQCMMNTKPDIAIMYKRDNENYIRFIECKFESDEGSYKLMDESNNVIRRISQVTIQNLIGEFFNSNKDINPDYKFEESKKVVFSRKAKTDKDKISISDLINLNKEVFAK